MPFVTSSVLAPSMARSPERSVPSSDARVYIHFQVARQKTERLQLSFQSSIARRQRLQRQRPRPTAHVLRETEKGRRRWDSRTVSRLC